MRIVYIHQYFNTRAMAGGTRSLEQAKRLVADGHDVHVVTSDSRSGRTSLTWRTTLEEGITVHWLGVPYANSMGFAARVKAFLRFAVLSSVKASRIGGAVVFATSTPLTVAVPGIIASTIRRARFVFEVRDLWPELPVEMGAIRNPLVIRLSYALARATYRRADHVVALSPGMAAGVAAHGIPTERISVVPNACDLDLFQNAAVEGAAFRSQTAWLGDRPLVVYLGTFGRVNGVGYLVHVAAAMRSIQPDVRFLLVGGGAETPEITALAEDLGVKDENLFILPEAPKARMPALLGAADIATSVVIRVKGLEANSANKFFDALAARRPIAINHRGWQADILANSGAGIVLDPDDPVRAAQALADRLGDRAWLDSASTAAGALATGMFSRDLLYEAFEAAVTGAPPHRAPSGASDGGADLADRVVSPQEECLPATSLSGRRSIRASSLPAALISNDD